MFMACALATPQRLFAQATPAPAPAAATAVPVELPRPEYPESLRLAGVAGKVVVRVTIGADGRVQDVNPVDGPKMLWAAVVPAAGQSISNAMTAVADGRATSWSTSSSSGPRLPPTPRSHRRSSTGRGPE